MSKSKKAAAKRKQNVESTESSTKRIKTATTTTTTGTGALPSPPAESGAEISQFEPKSIATVVSSEELEVTVDTLRTLAENPAVIKSKACKELRSVVYDFRQACTTGINSSSEANLTAKVSGFLADGKFTDALVTLAEMRIRGDIPRLGALCRWVRDLDITSGLSQTETTNRQSRPELLRIMDAILRATGQPIDSSGLSGDSPSTAWKGPIALQKMWDIRSPSARATPFPMRQSVLDGSLFSICPPNIKGQFKAIETTPGPQRKPPNLHPAVLHLSDEGAVPLSPTPARTITKIQHPVVPSLCVLKDVLSPEECKSIIAATESVGYLPDAPIKEDGSESSILAHNVYWIVDQTFHDALWERVRPFLPEKDAGRKARGINRRFRVYRYVPGAEYRCHFDGAWPPSGIHPTTGKYMYDASPADKKQSSLFTFLMYLNDEFEGGETTFFTPSVCDGVMNAHPVRPVMGSVAVFPHGENHGALLHEGTGVRKGAKYIIRTDVEFDVDAGRED
ncbi:hypothetical protein B0T20DRAFT_361228 [Sordaria brevicollis]|uniref:Fe2OG dioxygenase domain-containing protein n=1 Tax=Sordaria brevicollis TaxID=83679 RepID=A0AAE0P2V8_SORBR|nr:hypothetical protein B0T20DRAFT_361228 [Sordaria brevicollis]